MLAVGGCHLVVGRFTVYGFVILVRIIFVKVGSWSTANRQRPTCFLKNAS